MIRDPNPQSPEAPLTGKITALREHARKPGRYIVDLDGKQTAVVNASYIHEARLKVGVEIDEAAGDRLQAAARRIEAFDRAAAALGRRARSRHELERWLLQRGYEAQDVAAAVQHFTEIGALDDAAYARAFSRSRALGRGMSRRRLQQELTRRGVPRPQADAAIAEVMEEEQIDERSQLQAVAQKKWATLGSLDPEVARRRLHGFLARRGYDGSAIAAVMREVCGDGRARH